MTLSAELLRRNPAPFGTLLLDRCAVPFLELTHRIVFVFEDGCTTSICVPLRHFRTDKLTLIASPLISAPPPGLVARKLCSSMQSLGIPSVFLHPVEALHGDLGMLSPGRDVVIAISHSGGSPELQALLPHIKRRRCPLIAFTAKQESALGRAADAWVDCRTASADLGEFISRETNQKQQDLDVRIANSDVDSLPLEPTQINIQEEEQEREEEADGSGYSSNSPSGSVSNSTSNVSTPSLLYENNDSFSASNSNSSSNASSSEDVSSIEQLSIDETCEAFPHAPAPTCSTSVAMAMGDALVVASARADARAERLTQEEFKATLRKKEEERQVKIKEQQRLAQLEEANQTIHISSGGKVQFSRDDKKRLVVQVNDELDAKGLRRAFAKNHPGGSLGKELELEGDDNGQAIKV